MPIKPTQDPLVAQKLVDEKRKKFAAERLAKMNTSTWKSGYDTNDLSQQIKEKNKKLEYDNKINSEQDRNTIIEAKKALENDKLIKQNLKNKKQEYANELSKFDRTKCDTYDLNDKYRLSKDDLPRKNENNVPVSSLQKFDGEDPGYKNRVKQQQATCAAVLKKQMNDLHDLFKTLKIDDIEFAKKQQKLIDQLNELDGKKNDHLQNKTNNVAKFNSDLTNENIQSRKLKTDHENKLKENEINYNMNSVFLNENKSATKNVNNNNRYIPYAFKGYDDEVTNQYIVDREKQVVEKNNQMKNERNEEKKWANATEEQTKSFLKQQILAEERKKQEKQRIASELLEQTESQKKNKQGKVTVDTSDTYFSKYFGTSAR